MTALDELVLPEKERRRYEEWKQRRQFEFQSVVNSRIAQMYAGVGTTANMRPIWLNQTAGTTMSAPTSATTLPPMPPFLRYMLNAPSIQPRTYDRYAIRQLAQGMARPDPEKIFPVWRFDGSKW